VIASVAVIKDIVGVVTSTQGLKAVGASGKSYFVSGNARLRAPRRKTLKRIMLCRRWFLRAD
jgi:hypothetical protein